MRLNERPYWIQLIVLALFMLGGMLISSALGELVILLLYHTPQMLEASDPVTAIRISQSLVTIGTFLVPALLFAYCYNRQWFDYNAANRSPKQSMINIVLILSVTLLPVVGALSAFNQHIMPQEGGVAEFMRDLEEAANHILELVTSQRSSWDLVANMLVFAVLGLFIRYTYDHSRRSVYSLAYYLYSISIVTGCYRATLNTVVNMSLKAVLLMVLLSRFFGEVRVKGKNGA